MAGRCVGAWSLAGLSSITSSFLRRSSLFSSAAVETLVWNLHTATPSRTYQPWLPTQHSTAAYILVVEDGLEVEEVVHVRLVGPGLAEAE